MQGKNFKGEEEGLILLSWCPYIQFHVVRCEDEAMAWPSFTFLPIHIYVRESRDEIAWLSFFRLWHPGKTAAEQKKQAPFCLYFLCRVFAIFPSTKTAPGLLSYLVKRRCYDGEKIGHYYYGIPATPARGCCPPLCENGQAWYLLLYSPHLYFVCVAFWSFCRRLLPLCDQLGVEMS